MAECPGFEYLLVIPHLRVQNANAISSPLTHGFPAMSAFLGLMWALERQTHASGLDLQFNAVGVVAHDYDEQITDTGFVNAFRLTRNPVDKDGKTSAIVEEGRIHLDISLVFAVKSESLHESARAQEIAAQVASIISGKRIAGGTVIPSCASQSRKVPFVFPFTGDRDSQQTLFNQLKMRLLPGFALTERHDLLEERFQILMKENPEATRLDAWLSLARINWRWQGEEDNQEKGKWQHDREKLGWVVPIPVGYGALTELQAGGSVANARDSTTDFRFVESLYGIGQWISPHRLQSPQDFLWYADGEIETGLYRCRNDYRPESVFEYDFD